MRDKRTKADPCRRLAVAVAATLGAIAAAPLRAQVNYSGAVLYPLTGPAGYQTGVNGAAGGQVVATATNGTNIAALLWSEPSGAYVNLTPAGFVDSRAVGTDGTQQVGEGQVDSAYPYHALLWNGTAASVVDLTPDVSPIGVSSAAYATDGVQQVGSVDNQAALWSGTAASVVDLNPAGFAFSEALAISSSEQVGAGFPSGSNNEHALLWYGTAASAVDLNPAGFSVSDAVGVSGLQQVGLAKPSGLGVDHAFLWYGTAASAVDLNPAGFASSGALGTNGLEQVGSGQRTVPSSLLYALLWSGSAASAVELQPLLPAAGTWTESDAYSIDAAGNIYGTATGTLNGVTGNFAVEWSAIPNNLTWNNSAATGDGKTWDVDTNQNWSNGSPTVFNLYDNVTFNDANNGNYNVTLNTLIAATSVTFANNTGNYTLSGSGGIGGAATLNITGSAMVTISTSNSYTGPTTVTAGKLVIAAADALPAGNAVTIGNGTSPATMQLADGIGQVSLSSLTINPGGVLDITNNPIAINYTPGSSPAATIRQLLTMGYGNDTWTGPGIDSSAAALNPGRYAVGYADGNVDQGTAAGANQLLVAYTLAGDANLDGTVNFADLLVVAQNFNHTADTHGNPIDWADGDFNYDGVVNFADLLLVAQNFNQSLSAGQLDQLPGSFAAAWNLALTDVQEANTNNVPEPASVALLALAAAGLLPRRRRR